MIYDLKRCDGRLFTKFFVLQRNGGREVHNLFQIILLLNSSSRKCVCVWGMYIFYYSLILLCSIQKFFIFILLDLIPFLADIILILQKWGIWVKENFCSMLHRREMLQLFLVSKFLNPNLILYSTTLPKWVINKNIHKGIHVWKVHMKKQCLWFASSGIWVDIYIYNYRKKEKTPHYCSIHKERYLRKFNFVLAKEK